MSSYLGQLKHMPDHDKNRTYIQPLKSYPNVLPTELHSQAGICIVFYTRLKWCGSHASLNLRPRVGNFLLKTRVEEVGSKYRMSYIFTCTIRKVSAAICWAFGDAALNKAISALYTWPSNLGLPWQKNTKVLSKMSCNTCLLHTSPRSLVLYGQVVTAPTNISKVILIHGPWKIR